MVLPACPLLAALVADARGLHALAFYCVLVAVPVLAVTALAFFGELVDGSADEGSGALYVGVSALALLLVVIAAAARARAVDATVPALGTSAAVGALLLLGLQTCVWCSGRLNRAAIVSILRTFT
jgi:hypothetical protein